jgi:hypothetical protein
LSASFKLSPVSIERLQHHARNMRRQPTPSEHVLWQAIRGGRLGVSFRRQVPIGPYIVDFLASRQRVISRSMAAITPSEPQRMGAGSAGSRSRGTGSCAYRPSRCCRKQQRRCTPSSAPSKGSSNAHRGGHPTDGAFGTALEAAGTIALEMREPRLDRVNPLEQLRAGCSGGLSSSASARPTRAVKLAAIVARIDAFVMPPPDAIQSRDRVPVARAGSR